MAQFVDEAKEAQAMILSGKQPYELRVVNMTNHYQTPYRHVDPFAAVCSRWTAGQYGPRFPAYSIRGRRPAATCESFGPSGQNVVTGTDHYLHALSAAYLQAWNLWETQGAFSLVVNWKTQNVVGSLRLPYKINTLMFFFDHGGDARMGPELFAGMRYAKHGLKFIIFESGAMVITGAKTDSYLRWAWAQERDKFIRYKLGHEHRQLTEEEKEMHRPIPKSTRQRKKKKKEEDTEDQPPSKKTKTKSDDDDE